MAWPEDQLRALRRLFACAASNWFEGGKPLPLQTDSLDTTLYKPNHVLPDRYITYCFAPVIFALRFDPTSFFQFLLTCDNERSWNFISDCMLTDEIFEKLVYYHLEITADEAHLRSELRNLDCMARRTAHEMITSAMVDARWVRAQVEDDFHLCSILEKIESERERYSNAF